MKNKKGVSLVELIAAIVIMGIITAIAIPVGINTINTVKKKACIASSENVSRFYMHEMLFNVDPTITPEEALNNTLTSFGCTSVGEDLYDGICPSSACKVTVDDVGNISVICQKHGHIDTVVTADVLFSEIINTDEFKNYYSTRGSEGLDSTGQNYGAPITNKISSVLNMDLSDYSWRIYKTKANNVETDGTYQMYLSSTDVTKAEVGSSIQCMKYAFNEDGSAFNEPKSVTCYVKTKVVDGVTINYISVNP